jgi:hypothetical protein
MLKNLNSHCGALAKTVKPCQAAATAGGLCYFHANPKKASKLGRVGGRRKRHFHHPAHLHHPEEPHRDPRRPPWCTTMAGSALEVQHEGRLGFASKDVLLLGFLKVTGSRTIPRVNDRETTVIEIFNIARRELGSSHLGDGCDLRIRVTDRSAERSTVGSSLGKNARGLALEPEDATRQILGKHSFCRCQQPLSALPLGEQLNSVKDFRLGD